MIPIVTTLNLVKVCSRVSCEPTSPCQEQSVGYDNLASFRGMFLAGMFQGRGEEFETAEGARKRRRGEMEKGENRAERGLRG